MQQDTTSGGASPIALSIKGQDTSNLALHEAKEPRKYGGDSIADVELGHDILSDTTQYAVDDWVEVGDGSESTEPSTPPEGSSPPPEKTTPKTVVELLALDGSSVEPRAAAAVPRCVLGLEARRGSAPRLPYRPPMVYGVVGGSNPVEISKVGEKDTGDRPDQRPQGIQKWPNLQALGSEARKPTSPGSIIEVSAMMSPALALSMKQPKPQDKSLPATPAPSFTPLRPDIQYRALRASTPLSSCGTPNAVADVHHSVQSSQGEQADGKILPEASFQGATPLRVGGSPTETQGTACPVPSSASCLGADCPQSSPVKERSQSTATSSPTGTPQRGYGSGDRLSPPSFPRPPLPMFQTPAVASGCSPH